MSVMLETPPRRRKSMAAGFQSPAALNESQLMLHENDDAKEKRARRKSQLLVNNISSPGGVPASPGRVNIASDREKRKSVSAAGMSNEQVKAHYASCIKLSSENKINVKNAFALHLIDYMKDLLKDSQNADSGTNFQVASCTLDAGVKIYSYRVDAVHKDTFKVLGSLGNRMNNKDDEEEDEEQAAADAGDSQDSQKKVVKKRKKATIQKNLNAITSEQFDVDFEVDPFFHKTSSAFDEGGVKGLLSLQVKTLSDLNHLQLDSGSKTYDEPVNNPFVGEMTNLTSLKIPSDFEQSDICPLLKSFQLSGWDKDSDTFGNVENPYDSFDDNIHRFDVNAPTQLPDDDFDNDYDGGDAGGDDFSDNEDQNDKDIGSVKFDTTALSTLLTMPLQENPLQISEYSYFKQDVLSMWRGPHHWKVHGKGDTTNVKKKGRAKKEPFKIDFDNDEVDIKKMISSGRARTYLTETTLKKHTSQMTTLPPEILYDVKSLYTMFLLEKVMIKPMSNDITASALENENDVMYNYDNKYERDEFCPAVADGAGDYDDDDVGGTSFDMGDPQGEVGEHGESLIAPPKKVQILDINYAKSAKRVDIKKLKTAMWNMLTIEKDKENIEVPENTLPQPDVAAAAAEFSDKVTGNHTFKTMYSDLPGKVSTNMAKNLSGPISFVCLLYLANEKNLVLTGTEDMSDIVIESGL